MKKTKRPEKIKSKRGISGVIKTLFKYSPSLKIPTVLSLILASLGAVLTIIGPDKLREITDLMSASLYGKIDLSAIAKSGTALLVIYLLSALFNYIQHYVMATVTLKLSLNMRNDLSRKINRVPMKLFNSSSHGDILSRVTNDVSTLQQTLSNSIPSMISAVAQFAGCLTMMFITEWRMAIGAILSTMLGFVFMALIMSHSQKYFIARQHNLGTLNGFIEEMYTGHDVVRISRANDTIKNDFSELNKSVYDAEWKSQFLSGIMQPLMNVIGNLGYVAVCVIGAVLAINGEITFGVIVAFIMYVRLFTSPLSTIAQGMTNMQTAAAAGDRVFDFLEEEELTNDTSKKEFESEIKGEVEFKNVRFSYPDNPDKIIIKNFSAKVKPGQKVAIVGPTGAGKTTMVNLLMRFFEVNSGEILIDGVPSSEIKRDQIHSLFSMVLQDTWLFEGTVRENLVYNKEGVSDEEIITALKACGMYHFVKTLPDELDTVLSEKTTISAGQKQLLTIARAMIKNSPMLILDEATSSVDTRTELVTQKAMDRLMHNRTSFVIAHRLSTIRNADLILVMKDGDIIEQGTHEELLELDGFYAELYNSQFANKC